MNTKNDGGPAFPFGQMNEQTGQLVNGFFNAGMSLRDWFATHATPDDIDQNTPETINACLEAVYGRNSGTSEEVANAILALRCRARYKFADAMLKVRDE